MYDEAFKRPTVQHIKESGQTVAEVARELKINDNTVWLGQEVWNRSGSGCSPGIQVRRASDAGNAEANLRVTRGKCNIRHLIHQRAKVHFNLIAPI
ncbi:hypothetical protein B9T62_01125 [Paenibacillus donghaensis]|uniref:Uncharacterized protein n=1 Tax=Paenibacillus donghaensis TaxID=414771 RepID=A0A2Z2K520_9BACL|nr:hypothetical protein B9T62_01125 [Paenibacillus donghaensis]